MSTEDKTELLPCLLCDGEAMTQGLQGNNRKAFAWDIVHFCNRGFMRFGPYTTSAEGIEAWNEMNARKPKEAWQPISSAPKDGEKILLYLSEGNIVDGWWEPEEDDGMQSMGHDAGWHDDAVSTFPSRSFGNPKYYNDAINPPTYWQPLPAPPEATK